MSKTTLNYDATTDRVLAIQWSGRGDVARRKQAFGGRIGSLQVTRWGDALYRIPHSVTIEHIDEVVRESLLPSDRAVLTYPYARTSTGASAMRIRTYNVPESEA